MSGSTTVIQYWRTNLLFGFLISTLIASSAADYELKVILSQPLVSPSPDIVVTSVALTFPPGNPGAPPHFHSGPVTGYVVEGDFLFQMKGEPHRIIKAGGTFYENDRATHVWGGNASNTTTCLVIATVYGRPGEQVLTFVKDYPRESYQEALDLAKKGL